MKAKITRRKIKYVKMRIIKPYLIEHPELILGISTMVLADIVTKDQAIEMIFDDHE